MIEKDTEELERQITNLEAKYENMKRRFESQQAKMNRIYKQPVRFVLVRWYHKYIKRDQIV